MSHASRRPSENDKSFQTSNSTDQSTDQHRQAPRHDPASLLVTSFPNAQVGGDVKGPFYTAGRDIIVKDDNDLGFVMLSQKVSHGAMYDSAERYPAGRCHPGTREEIINTIIEWVNDPSPETNVLWLWGPPGAGKSSIMQTVSEVLYKSHRTCYAASFFFGKGVPGRGESGSLILTLAYQVACNVDGMREAVNAAMTHDPLLPNKNIETQFQALIVQPLLDLPYDLTHTPTIIIDGLDECQGSGDQRVILTLIRDSLTASRPVPLRFIIASRPEHAIRDEFDRPGLAALTEHVELDDSRQTSEDIRKYLEDGFDEIYENNRDVMGDVTKPWPPADRVEMFVRNASGQFIYASTVLRFIGSYSDYSDPQTQLEVISKPGPLQAQAFSPLDHLYITIVSMYPRREELMHVLGGLFIEAHLGTMVHYLDVSFGEVKMVLRAISSLIWHPTSKDQVSIYDKELDLVFGPFDQDPPPFAHRSFRDFLQDKRRSGEFWIDETSLYSSLFNRFIDTIILQLRNTEHRSHVAMGPKIVIPITYSHFWSQYLFSTMDLDQKTLSALLTQRLDDLLDALDAFPQVCNEMTTSHFEVLLPPLYAVRESILSLNNHIPDTNMEIPEYTQNELVSQIHQVIDICLQHTISVEHFIQAPNAAIYILTGSEDKSLETISQYLDVTEAQAVQFLKDNSHLIEADIKLVYHRDKKLSFFERNYQHVQPVFEFLMDEKRSGGLHRLFREAAIKTWRGLVVRLVRQSAKPLSEYMRCFISEFLKEKLLIRLLNQADMEIMLPLYTELCELDWSTLDVLEGEFIFFDAFNVLHFLHNTMSNPKSAMLMTPKLRYAVSTAMEKIYEAIIVRPTSINYFSHTPLLSDDITGIPPHNINPADDEHVEAYNNALIYNLDNIKEMLRVQEYGADSAHGNTKIDRVLVCTSILEFLLRLWATLFFQESVCFIGRDVGLRCRFLFEHASSSEKIRLALLTLRDLDSKCRLKPNLPISIVDSAREFLVRNQRQMDPENCLVSWLDELKGRSFARKETHPDSDVESDVEMIEDDDGDLIAEAPASTGGRDGRSDRR